MKYRHIEKLGLDLSLFGIGCMRLPYHTDESGKQIVDESVSTPLIRHAIDAGVNYFDTAYVYSGGRQNEIALGHALRDGYRDRVHVATKMAPWTCKVPEDMDRVLSESLEDLETDHLDFYLVHALSRSAWQNMKNLGVTDFLDRAKADGRIRFAAFSFHDEYDAFHEILHDYDWDLCQIQFNLTDENYQAGIRGLREAGNMGIPVVIMEGLLGGRLATVPKEVAELYDAFPVKRSPVEWAFRWIADHPEVATILSGVQSMEQCVDNLDIFDRCEAGIMTEDEHDLIARVREAYKSRTRVPCTGCAYCMDCPFGVNIPRVFSLWNEESIYGNGGKRFYRRLMEKEHGADQCMKCGACEEKCPQHLPIPDLLAEAHAELFEPAP